MNSKKYFFNNSEFLSNKKNQKEEKYKISCELNYQNNIKNNLNISKYKVVQNKNTKLKEEKNNFIPKGIEDHYNYELYKQSIIKCNICFFEQEFQFKYKTISVNNSFQTKHNNVFDYKNIRNYKYRNNITPIELKSELNLSSEAKNNKSLILGKPFNKDNLHLLNIIRVFDKSHRHLEKINKKFFVNKFNHYYIYKNRINNYNYLKFKRTSKFSKKENKKSLKKNYSTIIESNIQLFSCKNKGINARKNKACENKDKNIILERENKNTNKIKTDNEYSTINDTWTTNKTTFNSSVKEPKINDIKLVCKEKNENDIIQNSNNKIGLNKKIIIDNSNNIENNNSIDKNNNIRNSANFSRRFFYKYRAININRKSKSALEETENNNNNQSINESKQIKDNIKKEKIENIEKLPNKRFIHKQVQKNEKRKNSNIFYKSPKFIKSDMNQNVIKDKNLSKKNLIINTTNNHISINDNNVDKSLIKNKGKQNISLFIDKNENINNFKEKDIKEKYSMQLKFGNTFLQSQNNDSQNMIMENNMDNQGILTNSVIKIVKLEESKYIDKNNKKNSVDKNLINNRRFFYKSDKVNKSKYIFQNSYNRDINSPNNNTKENRVILEEPKNIEQLKLDRFKRRNRITKKIGEDKNNVEYISKDNDKLNLSEANKKKENPIKDKYNFYNKKKLNNIYENHKFHEIKSTSGKANIKNTQNKIEKNNKYKIES